MRAGNYAGPQTPGGDLCVDLPDIESGDAARVSGVQCINQRGPGIAGVVCAAQLHRGVAAPRKIPGSGYKNG